MGTSLHQPQLATWTSCGTSYSTWLNHWILTPFNTPRSGFNPFNTPFRITIGLYICVCRNWGFSTVAPCFSNCIRWLEATPSIFFSSGCGESCVGSVWDLRGTIQYSLSLMHLMNVISSVYDQPSLTRSHNCSA